MKEKIVKILFLYFIMIAIILPIKVVNAASFLNYTYKYKSTYIVPYGNEIDVIKSNDETVVSNNSNIARLVDGKLQIIGVGDFTVTVKKDNSSEETISFFSWNAYLKKGKYYTYEDEDRGKKKEILYSKVYLAVSKTNNSSSLKIEDYFYRNNNHLDNVKGRYITNYYDEILGRSRTSYYQYSFNKTFEDPIIEIPSVPEVESVLLDKTSLELFVNDSATLKATVTPENAQDKTVKFSSNDSNIAKVDQSGKVTALKAGETVIKASCVNGKTATCKVIVTDVKPFFNYPKSGKVVQSYSNSSIKVSIEKINKYYVSKIWLKNPGSQIKKVEAGWGKNLKTVNTMLNNTKNAIVGCNGSGFYLSGKWSPSESAIRKTKWNKTTEGYLVLSGGVKRRAISGQKTNCLLGILPNGSFKYYEKSNYSTVISDGVKDSFTFGPLMIKDGKKYTQTVGRIRQSYNGSAASRTAIGQMDKNNFIILATTSSAKIKDMASFGMTMKCNLLYNLDGGGSSALWFRGKTSGKGTQVKSSGRSVGDAICFVTE